MIIQLMLILSMKTNLILLTSSFIPLLGFSKVNEATISEVINGKSPDNKY
jgi:hypothetical protein